MEHSKTRHYFSFFDHIKISSLWTSRNLITRWNAPGFLILLYYFSRAVFWQNQGTSFRTFVLDMSHELSTIFELQQQKHEKMFTHCSICGYKTKCQDAMERHRFERHDLHQELINFETKKSSIVAQYIIKYIMIRLITLWSFSHVLSAKCQMKCRRRPSRAP